MVTEVVMEILSHRLWAIVNVKKISNWDVFNEVLHGNFFRRNFGKSFWNKILRRIRDINPNVDLAFNDYEILSSNFAKCYITYLDDVEIDFFGLQEMDRKILHAEILKI